MQEFRHGRADGPFVQDHGKAAGDEIGVDGVRGCQPQLLRHVGGCERIDHHLRGSHVERPVVLVDRLHDRQIGADQYEQHGTAGELAIEETLQPALEMRVFGDHEGQLVQHHDAGRVLWNRLGEQPEGAVPGGRSHSFEESGVRQIRGRGVRDKTCELIGERLVGGGEEEAGHAAPVDELLSQARLSHAAAAPHEDGPPWAVTRAHPCEVAAERGQLPLPPDEHAPSRDIQIWLYRIRDNQIWLLSQGPEGQARRNWRAVSQLFGSGSSMGLVW
ncbi:hypothetical protein HD596_003996 [Nonomuraea jabiensis]|uniref:Uncharacterized protein n=1 Tax=Nonomuraea jabiensis TaxID=882448 RepID=A0A7W9G4U1_9ACTN|nr:hypothetical protein [Nonomuraea jabiensis]